MMVQHRRCCCEPPSGIYCAAQCGSLARQEDELRAVRLRAGPECVPVLDRADFDEMLWPQVVRGVAIMFCCTEMLTDFSKEADPKP
jgi:hypothetical protein